MEYVKQEIIRLHDFFVDWMTGTIEQTDENYALFADSMGQGFYIVAPSGKLTQRDALLAGLYNTYNQRQNFRIWIENVQVRHQVGNIIVATYEEWQEDRDKQDTTVRQSSVVFEVDDAHPFGLVWQCVHETWLPTTPK